jgi:hypothetical protein
MNGQWCAFQVQHSKACPVVVVDGTTAFGGGNLLWHIQTRGKSGMPSADIRPRAAETGKTWNGRGRTGDLPVDHYHAVRFPCRNG